MVASVGLEFEAAPRREVPRLPLDRLSRAELRAHFAKRPVVIEGVRLADDAPIGLQALARDHASAKVTVARTRAGVVATDGQEGLRYDCVRLGDFLKELDSDSAGYLMTPLTELPQALEKCLAPPRPLASAPWLRSKLWI